LGAIKTLEDKLHSLELEDLLKEIQIKKPGAVLKPKAICNLGRVDVSKLLSTLEKIPESYWGRQDRQKENNYPVFHSTQHIVMRFVEPNQDPRGFTTHLSWKRAQK